MDNKKQYNENMKVLKGIEENLPTELKDNLMETVINTEQEDTAIRMLKDKTLDPQVRQAMEADIANGSLRFKEEVVNEEVAKKMDTYYEVEVKAAIADGRLTHPDDDSFFQKRMKKLDEKVKEIKESEKEICE